MIPASTNQLLTANTGYRIPRSLRFRSSASAYLSRTFGTPTSQNTWTYSCWLKRGQISGGSFNFGPSATGGNYQIWIEGDGTINFYNASVYVFTTTSVYRDPSAWYHIILAVNSGASGTNKVRLYVNGVEITVFSTDNRATFSSSVVNTAVAHNIGRYANGATNYFDGYLAEVNFIDGQALTPSSFGAFDVNGVWQPKAYTGTYGTNGFYLPFTDNTGTSANDLTYSQDLTNAIWTKSAGTASGDVTTAPDGSTTADKFTEDTTNAAHFYYTYFATGYQSVNVTYSLYVKAAGRSYALIELVTAAATLYALVDLVAGTISSATSTGADFTNPSSSITSVGNGWYRISISATKGSANTNIYPEFFLCQNSSYTSSYTGDGTSGMYIWGQQLQKSLSAGYYRATTSSALTSASNLGADQSNGASSWNFWTPNNISTSSGTTYDSMIDSPTNYADGGNGRGNYAVLNPLDVTFGTSSVNTYSNGNLTVTGPAAQGVSFSTLQIPNGKWYFEATRGAVGTVPSAQYVGVRIGGTTQYYAADGSVGGVSGSAGASYTTNNVIGVAVDKTAGTIEFFKDNVTQGGSRTLTSYTSDNAYFIVSTYNGGVFDFNFGQRPFTYTPPSGFSALNTQNLPTPTIANGAQNFDINLRGGTGAPFNVTGKSVAPDFVWTKERGTADGHRLFSRGLSFIYTYIDTSSTGAEVNNSNNLTAFNADGFSGGSGLGTTGFNDSGATYVDWMWKANGTGVTNTSGSITSTVSANTSAGFSVVTYTGTGANATVGHGLGVAPSMVIIKTRTASDWYVGHTSVGWSGTGYLILNNTGAAGQYGSLAVWQTTAPSSSVISLGTVSGVNANGGLYVAYCFAPVSQYSSFGSYTGNGSATGDGPMVYLGFRPRWILVKRTDLSESWELIDTSRDIYNVASALLEANNTTSENTASAQLDILSNGFKVRNNRNAYNASNSTYIYAAFAENPFKTSRAR